MVRRAMSDVIVVLPGIMGSVLDRGGTRWGLTGGAALRALTTGGGSIADLTIDGPDDWTRPLGDGVETPKLLSDLHLLPGLWKIDGYSQMIARIERRFEVVRGENLILFPYDWRRDIRAAATRLQSESHEWLTAQRSRGATEPKLILVAHSMGGLVSRYFLEVLGGWRDTRMLVTFGTPYTGSLKAVGSLVNGFRIGPVELDSLSRFIRSCTSVYQLLPTYRCIDPGDGEPRRVGELDLPGLRSDRLRAAIDFHDEIETALQANRKDEEYRTRGYAIHPIIGIEQPTAQSALVTGDQVELVEHLDGNDDGGDGTVPRISAYPNEWTDPTEGVFSGTKHGSLQNSKAMLSQLEGVLKGLTIDLGRRRSASEVTVAVHSEDWYPPGDVSIRLDPSSGSTRVGATIQSIDGSEPVGPTDLAEDGGSVLAIFAAVEEGVYRLEVTGGAEAVQDVFVVSSA